MRTEKITRALMQLASLEANKIYVDESRVVLGTNRGNDVAEMSGRGEFMKLDFDAKDLNTGTDLYIPARIGERYVRFSALGIGKNNGGITYSVSTRVERDHDTIELVHCGSCFGSAFDIFIQTVEDEL